ncbi:MAG: HAD-IIB family hydrolase [Myxococcota bacterium]
MKSLSALSRSETAALRGLVFDLDGTVLDDGGALAFRTYHALHRLAEAGLELVVCTGRSAAWVDALTRQWPLTAGVAENGSIAFVPELERHPIEEAPSGEARAEETAPPRRFRRLDRLDPEARAARARALDDLVASLSERHPELALTDDNHGRISDRTFDIGERRQVASEVVARVRRDAAAMGARTAVSSLHLHVTLDADDKASGAVRTLHVLNGVDETEACATYAYVGDSPNDAPGFLAFRLSFGVANVRRHASDLSCPPRFVSHGAAGRGFFEIAEALLAHRPR